MESDPYADLAQLLNDLTTPLVNKSSGTFFIATDDNASCRFAINHGEITHCCFKRFHGSDAIQAIQAGLRGRGRFSENNTSLFRDSDKVEHSDAVQKLGLKIATIEDPTAVEEELPQEPETPKHLKRTYRGQEIMIEEPSSASQASTVKKPPRMYRGQILED